MRWRSCSQMTSPAVSIVTVMMFCTTMNRRPNTMRERKRNVPFTMSMGW